MFSGVGMLAQVRWGKAAGRFWDVEVPETSGSLYPNEQESYPTWLSQGDTGSYSGHTTNGRKTRVRHHPPLGAVLGRRRAAV